jgi:membrane associated rhomboid family serine protease
VSTDQTETRFFLAEPLRLHLALLLAAFAVVFGLQLLVPPFNRFAMDFLAMDTGGFLSRLRLWQPVTAIFLHGGVGHFLGNMAFLWFFGSALANAWRRREFLGYFFLCGVAGSLLFFAFSAFREGSVRGLGASGAIFGLMIAYAMVFGERVILAFFMIPMKAKYFVAICFAIEIVMLLVGTEDGVGHIAHLGGAACGALCLKLVWRRQSRLAGETDGRRPAGSRIGGLEVMEPDDER